MCPSHPGALSVFEYQKILQNYSWGVLVHSNNNRTCQDVSFELEWYAFLKRYFFAFSMSDCSICKEGMRRLKKSAAFSAQRRHRRV
jgi:hypothetical protein